MSTTEMTPTDGGSAVKRGEVAMSSSLIPSFQRFGLVAVFLAVVLFFSALNPQTFPTLQNIQLIASTQAVVGFIALAVMLPMVVGQFDLSAGFQFGLAQGICAVLTMRLGLHPAASILVVVATGALVGLANGLLITKLRLPSFTSTLGLGIIVLGATQLVTGDQIISGRIPRWFVGLGRDTLFGIPFPFLYLIIAGVILWFVLRFTVWGRRCYAVGSNIAAAKLAGINSAATIVQAMTIGGVLCALAGCISVMMLGSSSPTIGMGTLMPAFAGAFLGATAFQPGRFNVTGTLVAVYLVGAGITGLQQLGVASFVEQFFNGGALLLAVILASYSRSK